MQHFGRFREEPETPPLAAHPREHRPPAFDTRSAAPVFSGGGVPARSRTAPAISSRRALTLLLVALVVSLAVVGVFFLSPASRQNGIGGNPGLVQVTVTSTAQAFAGGEPPTPTSVPPTVTPLPPAGGHPPPTATRVPTAPPTATPRQNTPPPGSTATPALTSGPQQTPTSVPTTVPTSTPVPTAPPVPTNTPVPPTATPVPTNTPMPTPTPNPFGSAATVTFSTAEQTLAVPQTLQACDGCSIDASKGTIPSQYVSDSVTDIYSAGWTANAHYFPADPVLTFVCTIGCRFPQGYRWLDATLSHACTLDAGFSLLGGADNTANVGCTLAQDGYQCYQFNGIVFSGGNGDGEITAENPSCGGGVYYTMPDNCLAYGHNGNDARNDATNIVLTYVNSHGLSGTLSGPAATVTDIFCSDSRGQRCNPGCTLPGYSGASFYQTVYADGYRYSYHQADAPTVQTDRLNTAVPAGYIGYNFAVCGSPTITSVNLSARTAQLTCSASGNAKWPWTQSEQQALQQGVAGLPKAQAISTTNGWQGVQSGSCAIAIQNNAPDLPQNWRAITLVITAP
jgi:hypothetical protein